MCVSVDQRVMNIAVDHIGNVCTLGTSRSGAASGYYIMHAYNITLNHSTYCS